MPGQRETAGQLLLNRLITTIKSRPIGAALVYRLKVIADGCQRLERARARANWRRRRRRACRCLRRRASEGFSCQRFSFSWRKTPSLVSLRLSALMAFSTLLSTTWTCKAITSSLSNLNGGGP